jgi:glyoxylase-like metal-dependent hydrolase (beta-lactamase superfamily II)
MITLKTFVFNPFQENTYLLFDESKKCIIIDPGMYTESERKEIIDFIGSIGLIPEAIVNTHCHVDHILGCHFLKEKYTLPFYIHPLEMKSLESAQQFGDFFDIKIEQLPSPDFYLSDDDNFKFGSSSLQIMHVPGHSEGSVALYSEADNFVLTGDVLFSGSIGRTDLPGGDYQTLIKSIREKLISLPGKVKVYPGHGPETSIQMEYDTNPFLV